MGLKLWVLLLGAAFLYPAVTRAFPADISGRWEIVHTSGDNASQSAFYPGGFSVFLSSGGSSVPSVTLSNSMCVVDGTTATITPTWTIDSLTGIAVITVAVDNHGLGQNVTFLYTGTYSTSTPVPGDSGLSITAITGTYYVSAGDGSACSDATSASPGSFVATSLPTLSSGSAMGSLDGFTADGGTAFDSPVTATITFSAPAADSQIAGTVSLSSNPTYNSGTACFAAPSGTVNDLTINSTLSSQSGILQTVYAEGLDPYGVPTTLVLNGYSANVYDVGSGTNSNPYANRISSTTWAVAAAIGEDDPNDPNIVSGSGVADDGTNNTQVYFYNVVGGACDGAGGSDAPFHFLAGKHIAHARRGHHLHGKPLVRKQERGRNRQR